MTESDVLRGPVAVALGNDGHVPSVLKATLLYLRTKNWRGHVLILSAIRKR
jgi:hypothetical protein